MKTDINNLFVAAKNNDAALKELTEILFSYGKAISKSIIDKFNIYNVAIEDIEDYILFVINYVYVSYIPTKKTFNEYVTFVMHKRLTSKIFELSSTPCYQKISLDQQFDDNNSLYEVIEDKSVNSIPEEISYNEFHFRMASPKAAENSVELKKKKLYALEELGYTGSEIMKTLKISEGQYRYLKTLIKKDLKDFKNKMELK